MWTPPQLCTHTYTHVHMHIYTYMSICICFLYIIIYAIFCLSTCFVSLWFFFFAQCSILSISSQVFGFLLLLLIFGTQRKISATLAKKEKSGPWATPTSWSFLPVAFLFLYVSRNLRRIFSIKKRAAYKKRNLAVAMASLFACLFSSLTFFFLVFFERRIRFSQHFAI